MSDVQQAAREFGDYIIAVVDAEMAHHEWRFGQAAFNVLHDIRPDLSERIRTTPTDPFYRNERLPAFYKWVREHWTDKP
jgi:hypothetical protein